MRKIRTALSVALFLVGLTALEQDNTVQLTPVPRNPTAPLQQQIADLNKLTSDQQAEIANMQKQKETDAAAALEARKTDAATAHQQGLVRGLEIGVGGMLILIILVFGIMRLTVSKRSILSR